MYELVNTITTDNGLPHQVEIALVDSYARVDVEKIDTIPGIGYQTVYKCYHKRFDKDSK